MGQQAQKKIIGFYMPFVHMNKLYATSFFKYIFVLVDAMGLAVFTVFGVIVALEVKALSFDPMGAYTSCFDNFRPFFITKQGFLEHSISRILE